MRELKRELPVINADTAGIALGAAYHWVSVPEDRDSQCVRRFGCFTADLQAMAKWLQACGSQSVASMATGVDWLAVFPILATQGFEVKLVNARHVKTVPGRKSDVLACQW